MLITLFVKEDLPALSIAKSEITLAMTAQMGRGSVIFGFWLVGYTLGFVAYFVAWPLVEGLGFLTRSMSSDIIGGLLSGLAGSFISLAILYIWSHSGSHS